MASEDATSTEKCYFEVWSIKPNDTVRNIFKLFIALKSVKEIELLEKNTIFLVDQDINCKTG